MSLPTPTAFRDFAKRSAQACARLAVLMVLSAAAVLPAEAVVLPGPPQNVKASPYVDGDKIYVSWDSPLQWGDVPVTGYRVTRNPDGVEQDTGRDYPYVDSLGVVKGTSYTFTVQAITDSGLGAPATSNAVVPTSVPGAPVIGSAVLSGSLALVSFSAPSDTGGLPINGYHVSGAYSSIVDLDEGSTALTHRVTGMPAGEATSFYVTADNDRGRSNYSALSNQVTVYPRISVLDVSVAEGNSGTKVVKVEVAIDQPTFTDVHFDLVSSDGTALSSSDYVAQSFGSQVLSGTYRLFDFTIQGDTTPEKDESFTVSLANVQYAIVEKPKANVTILDDDGMVLPSLSVSDVRLQERHSGTQTATFTVTASQPTTQPISFNIATSDGTATAGSDYVAKSLSGQSIAPGATTKVFTVVLNGDTAVEGDETFKVTLSGVSGATLADAQGEGTIVNDDTVISIGDASALEDSTFISFPVTLSVPIENTISFTSLTAAGTAGADDFQSDSLGNWNIGAGQTTGVIVVQAYNDLQVEPNETFSVTLGGFSGTGVVAGDIVATGTIVNDDGPAVPAISISDASVVEGNSDTKTVTLKISLSKNATDAVSFDTRTSDASAVAPGDYLSQSITGGFIISPGQTSAQLELTVKGDKVVEPNEQFVVDLLNVTGATVADGHAVVTIVNDDTVPTLSVADVSVQEGNSGIRAATFTASLSAPSSSPVVFDFKSSDGTGQAASDYMARSQTGLIIPAGQTSLSFNVWVNGDLVLEPDELFAVDLQNVTGATVADGHAVATIVNDEAAPVLSIADVVMAEGSSGTKQASFTVSLSQATTHDVTFNIATADVTATAGSDYVAKSAVGMTIPAGQTSATFNVTINGDTVSEPQEYFVVTVTNIVGATKGDNQAGGYLQNDDVLISIADLQVAEGNVGTKTLAFKVSLSAASGVPVKFDIATGDVSAVAGSDYVAASATGVTIPVGQTSATFNVTVNGDTTIEPQEFFVVTLSNISGANVGDKQAGGYLLNDDAVISIADVVMPEGSAGTKTAAFKISLSAPSGVPVKFDIATGDVTATAGSDYVAASTTGMTIPAGQTSATFNVTVNGDTTIEPQEFFVVTLRNLSGAIAGDIQAGGYLQNDDAVISIADVVQTEGNSGTKTFAFKVSLASASGVPVKFDIATADVSASAGSDYVAASATGVTIPAGQTSATFNVLVNGDTTVESQEFFVVTLSNISGANVGDKQAGGYIQNDDANTLTAARFDAQGLYDDLDDGHREPVLSAGEYATLLLANAKSLCARTDGATVIGVDAVENLSVLGDLAEAVASACAGKPKYAAVMAKTGASEGSGFLVATAKSSGVTVLGAPSRDAKAGLGVLRVQSGQALPVSVLLVDALPVQATARTAQLTALVARVRAELKADPQAQVLLLGELTMKDLVDLTARDWKATGKDGKPLSLPSQRMLVSPALLEEFEAARIQFPARPANEAPAQVLQLQP